MPGHPRKTTAWTAGDMRWPVDVERPNYVADGSGGQVTTWAFSSTIRCAVEAPSGSEPYGDASTGRVRTFQSFRFATWYGADVLATDRLSFQGVYWNIRQINNIDLANKFLEIVADCGVEQ